MITNFKIFEDNSFYNIDDYVILDLEIDDIENSIDSVPYYTKVAKVKKRKILDKNDLYNVEFFNGVRTSVLFSEIDRLATPEEVYEDELLNTRNKYNL
jgi:hypothetical protein